jgi:hypothetical protein
MERRNGIVNVNRIPLSPSNLSAARTSAGVSVAVIGMLVARSLDATDRHEFALIGTVNFHA